MASSVSLALVILNLSENSDVILPGKCTGGGCHQRRGVLSKRGKLNRSKKVRKASEPFLKVNIDTLEAVVFSLPVRAVVTRMIKRLLI
jgi:hypothetical protein